MPCYNSEAYVDNAILSCINQSYDNWELIIVNDGSTDRTLEIISSYEISDKRIRVFSKENGGYVSAVNFGLDHINGRYFLLLGSDDQLFPDLFCEVGRLIDKGFDPDLIGFRTTINTENSVNIDDNFSIINDIIYLQNSSLFDFNISYPQESAVFFTRDTSKMFKTSLIGTTKYLGKFGIDADGIFSMTLGHKATSFLCIPSYGYVWKQHNDSLSASKMDYCKQVDRLNNWIDYSDIVFKIQPNLITFQEKWYLIDYFYSIIESIYLENRIRFGRIVFPAKKFSQNHYFFLHKRR